MGLASAPLLGNGLDDLRGALESLKARESIRARITEETSGQFNDEGELRTRKGRASLIAEDGGAGEPLRLIYEDTVLTQAAREEAGRRNQSGPRDALRNLSAVRVRELLRAADALLEDLEGAEVTQEAAAGGSETTRALDLQLRAPGGLDREKGFRVSRTAHIRIDSASVPLSAEIRTHTEVRRWIFKVQFETTEKTEYGIAGQRLIAKRRENENRWKAWIVGDGFNRSVTTVEPL